MSRLHKPQTVQRPHVRLFLCRSWPSRNKSQTRRNPALFLFPVALYGFLSKGCNKVSVLNLGFREHLKLTFQWRGMRQEGKYPERSSMISVLLSDFAAEDVCCCRWEPWRVRSYWVDSQGYKWAVLLVYQRYSNRLVNSKGACTIRRERMYEWER